MAQSPKCFISLSLPPSLPVRHRGEREGGGGGGCDGRGRHPVLLLRGGPRGQGGQGLRLLRRRRGRRRGRPLLWGRQGPDQEGGDVIDGNDVLFLSPPPLFHEAIWCLVIIIVRVCASMEIWK